MDGAGLEDVFQWIQEVVEKRWGKFWGWTAFIVSLLLFLAGAYWFVFEP
jgi:hypothetical protein